WSGRDNRRRRRNARERRTTLATAHYAQILAGNATSCPPNGTADTRELTMTDSDPAHPLATAVQVKVSFADTSFTGSASGTANVPDLPPSHYSLTGVINDETTRAPLADVRVEVLNGVYAGQTASTDLSGTYTFTGLAAETFRLRASKDGYLWGEQNVT